MLKRLYRISLALCMLLASGSMAMAEDVFNPTNPPEPEVVYRLNVSATPAGVANVSGTGYYKAGTRVFVNTSSSDIDYTFREWTIDGASYGTSRGFYFTMPGADTELVAEYDFVVFDPASPDDPSLNYKWRMFLTADPPEAASFNINNGSQFSPDSWVTIGAYASQGFEFVGWFEDGKQMSTSTTFNYEMPSTDVHLLARFRFNPVSPADPESNPGQTDIDTGVKGDINGDGTVDSVDIVRLVNYFLDDSEYMPKYDINGDGDVDVQDVTSIVNIFLNSN